MNSEALHIKYAVRLAKAITDQSQLDLRAFVLFIVDSQPKSAARCFACSLRLWKLQAAVTAIQCAAEGLMRRSLRTLSGAAMAAVVGAMTAQPAAGAVARTAGPPAALTASGGSSMSDVGSPPTPLPGTALFLHGFKAWDRGGSGTAHVRVRPARQDRAFGTFPALHERSFVIEYSTSVPFAEAATAVRAAIDSALATVGVGHDDIIVHAHSMGGLIAARALAGTTPVAVFCYDSPFGGMHWLVAKAIREASGAATTDADASGGSSSSGSNDGSGGTSWSRILSDPLGLLMAKFGGGLLSRARMEPGQLAFLAPILATGAEGDAIRMSLREELMAMRRRGAAVHLALWDHPQDTEALEHAPEATAAAEEADNAGAAPVDTTAAAAAAVDGMPMAQPVAPPRTASRGASTGSSNPNTAATAAAGGAGAAAGGGTALASTTSSSSRSSSSGGGSSHSGRTAGIRLGILPPDIESSFLSLLPRHMFATADGPDGWAACEWRWHAQSSAGTVFDHLAQHGGGRMFDDGTPYKAAVLAKAWAAIVARQRKVVMQQGELEEEQESDAAAVGVGRDADTGRAHVQPGHGAGDGRSSGSVRVDL